MYRVPPLVEDNDEARLARRKNRQRILQAREEAAANRKSSRSTGKKMEYRPREKAKFASIEAGKSIDEHAHGLRALARPRARRQRRRQSETSFFGRALGGTCLYAARRMPEIADSIVDVDRAMRWGFGWELGPFQAWDAIGVESMAESVRARRQTDSAARRQSARVAGEIVLHNRKGPRELFRFCPASMRPLAEPPESSF